MEGKGVKAAANPTPGGLTHERLKICICTCSLSQANKFKKSL
jgi:hypothetical protein